MSSNTVAFLLFFSKPMLLSSMLSFRSSLWGSTYHAVYVKKDGIISFFRGVIFLHIESLCALSRI